MNKTFQVVEGEQQDALQVLKQKLQPKKVKWRIGNSADFNAEEVQRRQRIFSSTFSQSEHRK